MIGISIITATYNSAATLDAALLSFAEQDLVKKELVLVDGLSTDETCRIAERFIGSRDIFISEADTGIYNALNKGINLCRSEVIGVLHSDDAFYDKHVLSKVAQIFEKNPEVDIVYGNLVYVSRDTGKVLRYWRSRDYINWLRYTGWMPPHPTMFVRKRVFETLGGYNEDLSISADFEFVLRVFSSKFTSRWTDSTLVSMKVGGASNGSMRAILRKTVEDYRALRRNGFGFLTSYSALCYKNLSKVRQFWARS